MALRMKITIGMVNDKNRRISMEKRKKIIC